MYKWFRIFYLILIAFTLTLMALNGEEPSSTGATIAGLFLIVFGIFVYVRNKIRSKTKEK
jgi:L-asparagine transporter-like permease